MAHYYEHVTRFGIGISYGEQLVYKTRGLRAAALSFVTRTAFPRLNLLIIAVLLVAFFVIAVRPERIYGNWDAWAIWNVKARAVYFLGWDMIRSPIFHHPDYPPLLPIIGALLMRIFGDTPLVIVAVHGVLLAILLLLPRWRWWALLIVGVISVQYALTQYADLFIAVTLLAATVTFQRKQDAQLGLILGISLFVKNEGMVIALSFILMRVLVERRLPLRSMVVLSPFVIALGVYKYWVGAPSEFFEAGAFQRMFDMSRQSLLIPYMIGTSFIHFNFALPVVLLITLLKDGKLRFIPPLVVCAFILGGYWLIYTITPLPFLWHLDMSYDRLLFHLLPTFVYAVSDRDYFKPSLVSNPR